MPRTHGGERSRRTKALVLLILGAPVWCASTEASPNAPRVLIVSASAAPAYLEAVEGVRSTLQGSASVTLANLERAEPETARTALAAKPDLVVAVGSTALELVTSLKCDAPVIVTMVLASEPGRIQGGSVTLDLPPGEVLTRIKDLFPQRKRIAVIRGPALAPETAAEIQAQARKLGFELTLVSCASPKEAIEAAANARGKADFLWCLPDRTLYQGPTVSALALAAIRSGVALIGFSEGIVRAGALVGFYPDYRDIGRQTAASAMRMLTQGESQHERPRKVVAAINERVARVLGVPIRRGAGEVLTVQ